MAFVPPHLQFDADQGIRTYLTGITLGQRAASERNQGIMQSAQLADAATARAQQKAIADQTAAINAAEVAARIAENREKARRAALQTEALQRFEADVAGGMAPQQAMLKNSMMFLESPGSMGTAYKGFEPPFTTPEIVEVNGRKFARTGPEHYQVLSPEFDQSGPINLRPMIGPDGKVYGMGYVSPGGGLHTTKEQVELTRAQQLSQWQRQLDSLIRFRNQMDPRKQTNEVAAIDADIKMFRDALKATLPQAKPKQEPPETGGNMPPGGGTGKARVRVIAPDGRRGWIYEEELDKALKEGYQPAPAGASGSF